MKKWIVLLIMLGGLAACAGGAPGLTPSAPPAIASSPVPPTPSAPPAPPTSQAVSPEPDQAIKTILKQKDGFAFISAAGALSLSTPSGTPALIWGQAPVDAFAWSPDGTQIAFIAKRGIYRWTAATNLVDQLDGDSALTDPPSWTPDSTAFALTAGSSEPYITFHEAEPSPQTLRSLAGLNIQPRLAPQGSAAIAAREHIASRDAPAPVGEYEGRWAVPLIWASTAPNTEPVILDAAINVMSWERVAWSYDGELVAVSNVLVDKHGAIVEQLGPPALGLTGNLTSETIANGIAPDGNQIAVASLVAPNPDAPQQKHTELEIFTRPGGERTTIWQSAAREETGFFWRVSRVSWSPDGKLLAFAGQGSTPGGELEGAGVWHGAADGSNLQLVPGSTGAEISAGSIPGPPQWSADASQLLFVSGAGQSTINVWQVGASQAQSLFAGSQAAWRP